MAVLLKPDDFKNLIALDSRLRQTLIEDPQSRSQMAASIQQDQEFEASMVAALAPDDESAKSGSKKPYSQEEVGVIPPSFTSRTPSDHVYAMGTWEFQLDAVAEDFQVSTGYYNDGFEVHIALSPQDADCNKECKYLIDSENFEHKEPSRIPTDNLNVTIDNFSNLQASFLDEGFDLDKGTGRRIGLRAGPENSIVNLDFGKIIASIEPFDTGFGDHKKMIGIEEVARSTSLCGIKKQILSASQELDRKVDYDLLERNSNTYVSHLLGHILSASVEAPSATNSPGFGNKAHD